MRSVRRKPVEKVLSGVVPNKGAEIAYRKRLLAMIEVMHKSVVRWLAAAWREEPPATEALMASDDAADRLRRTIEKLALRWEHYFDEGAEKLAEHFAEQAEDRVARALRAILKEAGLTVGFRPTAAMRDVLRATVHENVGLIRSIPATYLREVEGIVFRSVATGRDLEQATREIRKQFGVAKRRAVLIARDQNNKATSAYYHAREAELGIEENVWRHSSAGKTPRPAHVAMNGGKYDVKRGMWDAHERKWVFPGQLINCRCIGRPVIPGFS